MLLIYLIKNDGDLLTECDFLRSDINRLNLEPKTILMEQIEDYLEHIKKEEESKIERILIK